MAIVIHVGSLKGDAPKKVKGEEPPSILELEQDALIRVDRPIRYELQVQRLEGELMVRGVVRTEVTFVCARCAESFSRALSVPAFCRTYPIQANSDAIDLTGDVREDTLLSLPMVAVCSPACKGLCPQCGVNRNKGRCGCKLPDKATPWKALDRLQIQ
ncbi:MAG: DUF177 domain-containing protein [Lentisphaerae bacterium]|nr:DUF177 domain-containing protein [Lentisphaerota bacterium]